VMLSKLEPPASRAPEKKVSFSHFAN